MRSMRFIDFNQGDGNDKRGGKIRAKNPLGFKKYRDD